MELVLPNNYIELEEEEMMYIDGGWSYSTVTNNVKGILRKYGYGLGFAARIAGFSTANILKSTVSTFSKLYWPAIERTLIGIGSKIACLAGPFGIAIGLIAALGIGYVLGQFRIFY